MQALALALAFAATGDALISRQSTCCFGITASGDVSGPLSQLSDGQNRVKGSGSAASYCISSNGGLTDQSGRGCILTAPTTQFQCDTGASPTPGFAVGSNGQVTHNGSGIFYVCPTGDNGSYNVYTQPPSGQQDCKQVSLNADNCKAPSSSKAAPAPAPSSETQKQPQTKTVPAPAPTTETQKETKPAPAPSTKTVSAPASSVPTETKPAPAQTTAKPAPSSTSPSSPKGSSCPANLNGNYQYPHLIVPVDSSQPNTAKGTSYNGEVSSTVSSIFNFDIPQSYAGHTCSLVFLLPENSQLHTSSSKLSGNGGIDFSKLSSVANQQTTAANAPAVSTDYGVTKVQTGNSYTIASFECPAGQAVSYEAKASGDTSLEYFQDYNDGGIGLYIVSC